jgi:predicted RNA-binding protein with PIN domain
VLLVDAFNVIRAQWVLPPKRRGMDVHDLIRLIARSRFADRRLRVVVDGRPGPQWLRHGVFDTLSGHAWTRVARAEVVFSGRDHEADDLIEEILARSEGLKITVVSSDRRLIAAAGAAGADQIGNGSFLRLLNEDLDRAESAARPGLDDDAPLDTHAVARWMREFGYEPIMRAAAAPPTTPPPPSPARSSPAPKPPAKPTSKPPAPAFGSALRIDMQAPEPQPELERLDPMLRDAFAEWYGALHLGDLDMRKWLDNVEPL